MRPIRWRSSRPTSPERFCRYRFRSSPSRYRRRNQKSPLFEGGVAARGSRIDFNDATSGGYPVPLPTAYFLEPRLFVRGLWGMFGAGMQFGLNLPLNESRETSYSIVNAALTMSVRFSLSDALDQDSLSDPLSP